jgi:hypothetical protein
VHEQSSDHIPEYTKGDVQEAEDAGINAIKDIKNTAN